MRVRWTATAADDLAAREMLLTRLPYIAVYEIVYDQVRCYAFVTRHKIGRKRIEGCRNSGDQLLQFNLR